MADPTAKDWPTVIVVMGVAGSGKTTVGQRLAKRLAATFEEGDAYHSPQNVEKMRAGTPLTDADRGPWLNTLAAHIERWSSDNRRTVLACSALKERYRTQLLGSRRAVALVYLKGSEDLIRRRLEGRRGHYMPVALLASQFAALEEPKSAIVVDIGPDPKAIVEEICDRLAKCRVGT